MRVIAIGIGIGLLASAAASAAPHGKVVRVERGHGGRVSSPRLCEMDSHGKGMCLGAVRSGDLMIVVDTEAVVAQLRVDEASVEQTSCPSLTSVHGTFLGNGSFTKIGRAFGVIDGDVDTQRGRLIADTGTIPSPSGSDKVVIAIDRDGDQVADILMTQGACDSAGNSLASGEPACLDVWTRTSRGMLRVQHVNIASCH